MIGAEIFTPCFSTNPACRADWGAVAAVGGWVSAFVTFLAVFVPILRERKREKLQLELLLSDFIPVIRGVQGRIDALRPAIDATMHRDTAKHLLDLQISATIPSIALTSKNARLVSTLRLFQAELSRWNEIAVRANEERSTDLTMPSGTREYLQNNLLRLEATLYGVREVVGESQPHLRQAALLR